MKVTKLLFVFILLLFSSQLVAQDNYIKGKIYDSENNPMMGVNVSVYTLPDTTFTTGAMTDSLGNYSIALSENGSYQVAYSFVGFFTQKKKIEFQGAILELPTINLEVDEEMLQTLEVKDRIMRVEINGDTVEFNANAYQLHKSAMLEDLIKKLPGVTFENGQLMANGEPVTRITIDGQDFFGDDVIIALKNLPAEMIDKVQLFNKDSESNEQGGTEEQGINLVTKEGMNKGVFGRIEAGLGTQYRFQVDGMLNFFKPKTRVSVFFMTNNINKQNFDYGEVTKTTEQGYESFYDLYSGDDDGIATTSALGINFNQKLKGKTQLGFSYLINNKRVINNERSREQYFYNNTATQEYLQESDFNKNTLQQIISSNFEWKRDSTVDLRFKPQFSLRNQSQDNSILGENKLANGIDLNKIATILQTEIQGWQTKNEFRFTYKFRKNKERKFNIRADFSYDKNNALYNLNSDNYFYVNDSSNIVDQESNARSNGLNTSINLKYTEPLSDLVKMSFGISTSFARDNSNWSTMRINPISDVYNIVDTSLTNVFFRNELKNAPYLQFNVGNDTILSWFGLTSEFSQLFLQQDFPNNQKINKQFTNLLPYAGIRYKVGRAFMLSLHYYTRTNLPNTMQLQPLVNNVNPLFLSTGNPNLDRSYIHSVGLYIRGYHEKTSQSYSAYISYGHNLKYIGRDRYLSATDTVVQGVEVGEGVQMSTFKNFDKSQTFNYFLNYTLPINKAGLSLNAKANGNYNTYPGTINNQNNITQNFNMNYELGISSTFSENIQIDIYGGYNHTYTTNSLQQQQNQYASPSIGLDVEWQSEFGLRIQSDFDFTSTRGLSDGFNRNVFLWNAEIGYQFLKDKTLGVMIGAYDILKQNTNIYRNVTEVMIQDITDSALTQFFYLKVSWQLRFFKGNPEAATPEGGKGKPRGPRHH